MLASPSGVSPPSSSVNSALRILGGALVAASFFFSGGSAVCGGGVIASVDISIAVSGMGVVDEALSSGCSGMGGNAWTGAGGACASAACSSDALSRMNLAFPRRLPLAKCTLNKRLVCCRSLMIGGMS